MRVSLNVEKRTAGLLACFLCLMVVNAAMAGERQPTPVSVERLKGIEIAVSRDAPATVVSLNDTRISAEIAGRLQDLSVLVGNKVKKGDVLATLDCSDYRIQRKISEAALLAAQAQYRFDRKRLEKARKLSKKKNISAEELDRRVSNASVSNAEVQRLQAELKKAERSVEKCVLYAPFNAVVVQRLASIGDFLQQGSPVLRLLDEESIELSAKVQEQDIETMQSANRFEFAVRENRYPVELRAILPLIESRGQSYEVRFSFTGAKASPGATGRIEWNLGQGWVPSEYFVRRKAGMGLFVLREGQAVFVPVEQAKEGLASRVDLPGATVIIVDGRYTVADGEPVRVVDR